jgi:tetratricopeptide (TPR) repeat protein
MGSSGVSRSSQFEYQPQINYLKYINKNNIVFKNDILTVKISVLAKNREDTLNYLRVIEDIPKEVMYIDSNPKGRINETLHTLTWNLTLNYPNEGHFSYRIRLKKSGNYVISGATRIYPTIESNNKEILQSYQIDPIYATVYNRAPKILNVEYDEDIWWVRDQEIRAKIFDPYDNKELKCKLLLDGSKEIAKKRNPEKHSEENLTYYEFAWPIPDLGRGLFQFKLEPSDDEAPEITIGDPIKGFPIEEGLPINLWYIAEILLSAILLIIIDFFVIGFFTKGITQEKSRARAKEIIDFIVHHKPFSRNIPVKGETITLDKKYASDWSNKGAALCLQGKYDESIQASDKAIELNPNLAEAWDNKGETLRRLGKYDEAIVALDKAIKLDPDLADSWNNKGKALKALGRSTEADAAFAKAKELEHNK